MQRIRGTRLMHVLESSRWFGRVLLLVSSTSWFRGRDVPFLWGSNSVCGTGGASSILEKGQLWILMRGMADGWRGVKETAVLRNNNTGKPRKKRWDGRQDKAVFIHTGSNSLVLIIFLLLRVFYVLWKTIQAYFYSSQNPLMGRNEKRMEWWEDGRKKRWEEC